MRRELVIGLAGLALIQAALGQTQLGYTNSGSMISPPQDPPQIDALNFVNSGIFAVDAWLFTSPYATANTTNYINSGKMEANTGFQFDTFSTATQQRKAAAGFLNTGTINSGSSTNLLFSFLQPNTKIIISATNTVNHGTINLGPDSLLSIKGKYVDLSRGLLNMEGFEAGSFGNGGSFDEYWGVGTTRMNPSFFLSAGFVSSPNHVVTNRNYLTYPTSLFLPGAVAYTNGFRTGPSNMTFQAAFVRNTNSAFSTRVYFPFQSTDIVVEWNWTWTNIVNGSNVQDSLVLVDSFGSISNLMVVTNGVAAPSTAYKASYIPTNYNFFRGFGGYFNPATPGLPAPGFFNNSNITNEYASYGVLFLPYTSIPQEIAGQNLYNLPGRMEITADSLLSLERARISSLNYLRLTATNHFTTDGRTKIVSPFADFDLHSTNGVLVFTNLLASVVPRLSGEINLWSARWTWTSPTGITNDYNVLLVDSMLSPTAVPAVANLTLRSTNVIIGDALNVLSNLLVDATTVVITTNGPGSTSPAGAVHLQSSSMTWPTSFPRLQYLTNFGSIQLFNMATFVGQRNPPWYPTSFIEPYQAFVNHGSVTGDGCQIWANYFENHGLVDAGGNSIDLQSASVRLAAGQFLAPGATLGNINLQCGSLFVSNHVLRAGNTLTLSATNYLYDGGVTNGNVWTAGNGFNLRSLPPVASLLGTTITSTAPPFEEVFSQWAGRDLGYSVAGYNNNAALGRLILDAGNVDTTFTFLGTGTTNALYVDYLELVNAATNRDSGGNLTTVGFAPGMKIYYAQAMMNGVSVAEKLNHKNNDSLRWVSSYAGQFSSTNLVYANGTTNIVNAALAVSSSYDSDNDGTVNRDDSSPLITAQQIQLQVALTNTPAKKALLSWWTLASSPSITANPTNYFTTNYVFWTPGVASPSWQMLTNFASGPSNGRVSILDSVVSSNRFYRVVVQPAMP